MDRCQPARDGHKRQGLESRVGAGETPIAGGYIRLKKLYLWLNIF
jgi:hypothetical protein